MSTDANGAFDTAFEVPLGTPYGSSYTLFAGDHVGRYFPAATYEAFEITAPAASGFFDVDETHTAAVVVAGQTTVDFGFPEGTGGTWTATITNAGPEPEGFSLAGDPYIYYNLETTAVLGGAEVEVCIAYDTANIPIPPRLFHHERVVDGRFRWVDIIDPDASTPGRVCGTTTSFSAYALGYPDQVGFDFEGFFAPVTMTEPNLAKPGQAIPVRFLLNGDQGLDVVTSARFIVQGIDPTPEGDPLPLTTAGGADSVTTRRATPTRGCGRRRS